MKVLWFSGGKDSMACLYMLRAELSEITVIFANTGKNYPEALEVVERARAMCPNWIEIPTDRDRQWSVNGFPSDLVPVDWTVGGQLLSTRKSATVQASLQCCFDNITGPLWAKSKQLGAAVIIKGQRADEAHKSTSKDGDVVDGMVMRYPVQDWTREQVLSYLREQMGKLPAHYALDHSSMDCYDCTAFAAHSHDRAEYMRERHPEKYADYLGKIDRLCAAIEEPLKHYQRIRMGTTPCPSA